MKRFLVLFVAVSFLFCGSAFAAEAMKSEPAAAVKEVAKEAKMSAKGKVTEISDTMLKIERTVKGKTEIMELTLEKAYPKIAAGDMVKVSYTTKDGKNVATKVTKSAAKKAKKAKKAAKEAKPAEEKATPAAK